MVLDRHHVYDSVAKASNPFKGTLLIITAYSDPTAAVTDYLSLLEVNWDRMQSITVSMNDNMFSNGSYAGMLM